MKVADLVTIDPEILGGTPVFKGMRVPVKTSFEYLEGNYSLEEFLDCFPAVSREAAGCVAGGGMNILLDECVPWPVHRFLIGRRCTTPQK